MEELVELTIRIPRDLYEKVRKEADESGFTDINEFIVFVLSQLVETSETGGEVLSKEDEEKVRERLRSLGYID